MEIPNLTPNPISDKSNKIFTPKTGNNYDILIATIIALVGLLLGFGYTRYGATKISNTNPNIPSQTNVIDADTIRDTSQVQVGQTYGTSRPEFKDIAIGLVSKGGQNGEGTHTLERDGGKTQWAALTSSTLDLDLFVGKKVQIYGQTYSSTKAGWLLDVGTIKVLE